MRFASKLTALRSVLKTYKTVFIAVLLTSTLLGFSVEVSGKNSTSSEKLTIPQAVDSAVRDNPGLAKMQARYEAMTELPSQLGSLPDPMLS